jgi:hypothetical protein
MILTVITPYREAFASVSPLVAAGNNHSLALKSDGTLWAWGDNAFGQLGIGDNRTNIHTPIKILDNINNIAANGNKSFARTITGEIFGWGEKIQSPTVDTFSPSRFFDEHLINWNGQQIISYGSEHTLAIQDNRTFISWGANNFGQLGNGTFTNASANNPAQVLLLSDSYITSDNRYEFIIENNNVTIVRYLGSEANCVIPSSINNISVVKIADDAFAGNNHIQRVTIPPTVTSIGLRAFANCASLLSAKFEHTNALTITTFGNGNTNNNTVFAGHGAAFTVLYPPNATNFTTPTWMGYPSKQDGESNNATQDFDYNIAPNGDVFITRYKGNATTVAIPATIENRPVRRIERRAFENNTRLTTVTIPSGITLIGEQAFIGCENLTRITIPATVTVIEDRAFAYCTRMTNARFMHSDANLINVFGSQVFMETHPSFKITYSDNARGFTTPSWKGYPAEPHLLSSDFDYKLENNGITITRYKGTAAAPLIPATFDEYPDQKVLRIDTGAFEKQRPYYQYFYSKHGNGDWPARVCELRQAYQRNDSSQCFRDWEQRVQGQPVTFKGVL